MSKSFKIMNKLSSTEVVAQNKEYVEARRKGLITSIRTKFPKLNKNLMGGIENDTITTISALSGAGKSTISKCFRDSFVTFNKKMKFKQYVFNFEMISHQQIGRSIVTESRVGLKDLYSVEEPLTDEQYKMLESYWDTLASRDIDFIDVPDTPDNIVNSIVHYWEKECKINDKTIVYEIDHALLCKGKEGQKEKDRIDDLMYGLVDAKKYIQSKGGHSVGLVLSQMNRDIRQVERIRNNESHRPDTSCLFGASSIEQCSDYIIFSHIPAKLGIQSYTPNQLPTKIQVGEDLIQMVYFELVKNRSGVADLTIPMWNKLAYFDFDEMEYAIFNELHSSFKDTGAIPVVSAQLKL
jgi:hypothetical protein